MGYLRDIPRFPPDPRGNQEKSARFMLILRPPPDPSPGTRLPAAFGQAPRFACLHVCHKIARMEIEFDPEKAAANPLRHAGVTFEEGAAVLRDPYALTHEDTDAQGETRLVTLGMGGRGNILVVVWTVRDERIRLISAWKANQPQRNRYEQQF